MDETTNTNEQALDDRGTNEEQGRAMLRHLRDNGFEADNEKLALALGRPIEDVEAWMDGSAPLDDDIVMKARGIATQRGITIE